MIADHIHGYLTASGYLLMRVGASSPTV